MDLDRQPGDGEINWRGFWLCILAILAVIVAVELGVQP